jgi:hypothetical protein
MAAIFDEHIITCCRPGGFGNLNSRSDQVQLFQRRESEPQHKVYGRTVSKWNDSDSLETEIVIIHNAEILLFGFNTGSKR